MADLDLEEQNEIVLALLNITSISEQTFRTLLSMCTMNEQSSILKYKHRIDQLRSLLAIIQIKFCFKNYIQWDNDITIIKDSNGKPRVTCWEGDISISHSAEWIFTGICTKGTIGVDIENLNPFPFIKGSEQLFLSEKELCYLKNNLSFEESKHYLLTMWTLKEAYMKEQGKGLSMVNPTSLSFNYTSKKNCFFYHGEKDSSTLTTYDLDGVAIASISTSSVDRSSIQFYKHDQRKMLNLFTCQS